MQNFKISIGALEWAEISRPPAISRYCTSCRLLNGGFAACEQSAEASFRMRQGSLLGWTVQSPNAAAALGPGALRRYSGTSRSSSLTTRSSRRRRAFSSSSSIERTSIA
jgi:hypothetical protein